MSSIKPSLINNPQFRIQIEHIPTQEKISFDSWLTAFSDQFNSNWSGTPVYGRMDDLYTFTKTSRQLTLGFDVIAVDSPMLPTLNRVNSSQPNVKLRQAQMARQLKK